MELVDYLLLDYVSEFHIPLDNYFSSEVDVLLNKPHHDILSDFALSKRLAKLIDHKLITLYYFTNHYQKISQQVCLSDTEILTYISQQNTHQRIYTQLTPKGGEAWEQQFKPIWTQYHTTGFDKGMFIIQAGSKDYLYHALKVYKKQISKQPIEQLSITSLKPWPVNYWKTLPTGFQTYFQVDVDNVYMPDELLTWRYQWGSELKDGLMKPSQWKMWQEKEMMWKMC
ncbi:hypothetical protein [Candidatus Albibeggiatoa sp. nov. NOAA]|uniref:hypothetical protein n=1 Tax=Candidatus Albibeggiatoa sp. nov. NOAA TaxID=3162724 RepID=UPI0032FB3BA5|nr:hypothetical protein [Thiotrichaceae bacterium]